jgi:hypothetical protein
LLPQNVPAGVSKCAVIKVEMCALRPARGGGELGRLKPSKEGLPPATAVAALRLIREMPQTEKEGQRYAEGAAPSN